MTMTSQISFSGNTEIDGVLCGTEWSSSSLTFSFAPPVGANATVLNDVQKGAVRQILNSVAAVTNLSFSEVAETPFVKGVLRFGESSSLPTAAAYLPSENAIGGDVSFNPRDYNDPRQGTYAYATFLHETGHALGLDHGQDGDFALPADHDSLEYSVMTYRSYPGAPLDGYTAHDGSYPRSFMLSDIAALQYMYGADYGANAGATTYKWSPSSGELFINGVSAARSVTNTIFETIWDGGGTDTYDFSAYTTGLRVDINPGAWTTTNSAQLAQLGNGHVARGNIANAYLHNGNTASLIENVLGGSGSDRLTGNAIGNKLVGQGGNDKLLGNLGSDILKGGSGSDRFVFNTTLGAGNIDRVKDFRHDADRICLDDKIFAGIGSSLSSGEFYASAGITVAHDSTDRIVYDTASGNLYCDVDGLGGTAAVHFATLTTRPTLDHGDFAIV
jgi:serralysin